MLHFNLRWVGSEIEPLAFRASMVRSPPTDKPIVVFTRCDRITGGIRKALLSSAPLTFAESEQTLHQHAARGARLVVLHANGGLTASRAAGRLLRAVPDLAAPIVGLSDTATSGMVGAVQAELMNDLLQTRFERWLVLLQAWLGHPQGARQRVSELRLLHACAPARILPLLDPLMLVPDSELSVKRWSLAAGQNRTRLYRDVVSTGLAPADLVDVARTMHLVGSLLVERAPAVPSRRAWSIVRTERRIVARTLGLTFSEIAAAGAPGSMKVRTLIADRLRRFFERVSKAHPPIPTA